MTPEMRSRLIEICTDIPIDMEADVDKWDGQIVSGRQIATMHGELTATIAALANVLKEVLTDEAAS